MPLRAETLFWKVQAVMSVKRLSIGSMEIDMFHYALSYTTSQRVVVLAIAKLLIGMSQGYLF